MTDYGSKSCRSKEKQEKCDVELIHKLADSISRFYKLLQKFTLKWYS